MAADGSRVDIDTSELERDVRALRSGLEAVARVAPRDAAARTAQTLRADVPIRTGRLARSVQVVDSQNGAGVSYGAGIPYASYIDKRTHAVANALDGADSAFVRDCEAGASREANRL